MTKTKCALGLVLVLALFFTMTPPDYASGPSYRLITTITGPHIPPPGTWQFDISWIDQSTQMYYFSDSSNAQVDFINTHTNAYVGSVGGFTGYHGTTATKGPNGLLTDRYNRLWVGNGDSTVKVIDLASRKIIASISTGGKSRADEMSYDPADQLIVVTNGDDTPPFATFISVTSYKVIGKLVFPEATEGLEQPLWNAKTGHLYLSVPATSAYPSGELAVINPHSRAVEKDLPLPDTCHPTGLAVGLRWDIMVGCDGHPVVLDARTGTVEATISQVSNVDEVWYNSGDQRYYLAAGRNLSTPAVGVVDGHSLQWLTNIPVVAGSHSVAVDAKNNHIFVPQSGKGIGVYGQV
jgi:hypothetical protein